MTTQTLHFAKVWYKATMTLQATFRYKMPVKPTVSFLSVGFAATGECQFDKSRMRTALSSKSIEIPNGLSREEKRQLILKHSK